MKEEHHNKLVQEIGLVSYFGDTYILTIWICLSFCLFCVSTFALDRNRTINQFHHTAWTAKDGAPSQISALTQTEDGFLWIGSALGLFRFDGTVFEQYESPVGIQLPSHNIYKLMATPDNGLWISFRPSGLGFLKDGQLKVFTRPEELPKSQVYNFARTPDGRIWAGTHDGLALFNGSGWDDIGTNWNFQPNRVRAMFVDRSGTLWISKEDSIVFLPPGAKSFQDAGKQSEPIFQFAQAKDERLWGVDKQFIIKPIDSPISDGTIKKNPELNIEANGLHFDRDGSLWVGAGAIVKHIRFPEMLGTEIIQSSDSRVENFKQADGFTGSVFDSILEDREGNIWIGTTKGLNRFRYSSVVPVALDENGQKLTLTAGEDGEIWAGSALFNTCLHFYEGRNESFLLNPKDTWVSSFYKDDTGSIWWGAYSGIVHQQNKKFKLYPPPAAIKKDYMWEVFRGDNDGGLWVNFGDEGLIYFKDGAWERRKPPEGLPDRGPSASFQDDQKRIWLGYTENRIFVLDGERVQGYTKADGIEIGRIKVIRGRGGNYWFGGELGLAFIKDGRFHTVKTNGKQFDAVSGIIQTKNGDLWLNETVGIINIPAEEVRRLNENPEYAVKYRLYDFQDNLPGGPQMNYTVSTAVEATDGRLWFATDNGLAVIDPQHLEKNSVPPPVTIKSLNTDEKSYSAMETLELPKGTSSLRIAYTALSLSVPERVRFRYRLEGVDPDWREADTRREAFYTNLGPGKYRFQVIAANNDGVWNEEGAVLEFKILPLFYQTSWFLVLCLFAFTLLFWAGFKWRVHLLKSRLNLQFEERLAERTRIAHELHDSLLQGFVSASMQLGVLAETLTANPESKSQLSRILQLIRRVTEEGRNTLRGLAISDMATASANLEHLFADLREEFAAENTVDFSVVCKGEPRRLRPAIHDDIYRIGREAVLNAFRHSNADSIEVVLEYTTKDLRVLVIDNGIGIDPQILESGREGHWGLSGMRTRAEKINARLKVRSRANSGTEVELIVPNQIAFN